MRVIMTRGGDTRSKNWVEMMTVSFKRARYSCLKFLLFND